ncbi:hypothetical protein B0H16DRAFT_1463345 [Mycena metata]|uniref:Uncharacterized protein n=1 Tax=Mycena metata TaxID=1033252 RepID=A0AAD7IJ87_9AGAR|nr:hypothetical protein B0H16DRAFT_1463345 [Mycena metata]
MSTSNNAPKAPRKKAAISGDQPKSRIPTAPTRRSPRSVSTPAMPVSDASALTVAGVDAVESQPLAGETPAGGGYDAGTVSTLPPLQTVSNSSVTDATESVSVDGAESPAATLARASSLRTMYVGTLLRATNSRAAAPAPPGRMVEVPDEEDFHHRGSVIASSSRAVLEPVNGEEVVAPAPDDIPTSRAVLEAVEGLKALQLADNKTQTVRQSMGDRLDESEAHLIGRIVHPGEGADGAIVNRGEGADGAIVNRGEGADSVPDETRVELGKLLTRPNYGARAYSAQARNHLVAETTSGLRSEFYKIHVRNPAVHEDVVVNIAAANDEASSAPFETSTKVDSGAAGARLYELPPHMSILVSSTSNNPQVPPSLSSVGPGSVSVLPGVGKLPTGWGAGSANNLAPASIVNGLPPIVEGDTTDRSPTQAARDASIALRAAGAANGVQVHNNDAGVVNANVASRAIPQTTSHWTSYNFRNVPKTAPTGTAIVPNSGAPAGANVTNAPGGPNGPGASAAPLHVNGGVSSSSPMRKMGFPLSTASSLQLQTSGPALSTRKDTLTSSRSPRRSDATAPPLWENGLRRRSSGT